MVEDHGRAALIPCSVPLVEAVTYGKMLTTDRGHSDRWATLARRSSSHLRAACIPPTPLWSEDD